MRYEDFINLIMYAMAAILVFILLVSFYFILIYGIYLETVAALTIEFSAGCFGVLFGFNIDRTIKKKGRKEDKTKLENALRTEFGIIKGTPLEKGIYPDIWDSAKSSGRLDNLLNIDQVIKLAQIYRSIRELDIERKKVKQYQEDYETSASGRGVTRKDLYERWKGWELTHKTNTQNLNQQIEKILQDRKLWQYQLTNQ